MTHLAFFGLAPRLGQVTTPQVALAAAADALILAYVLATTSLGGGRSPADLLGRTRVGRDPRP
jgi:hypothetical protein